ncbi:MAG: hypothetical protein P1P89_06695 [Desulfobacterales bacterium]|nr:hypothetical protein [Desulfobacterales bacterium]
MDKQNFHIYTGKIPYSPKGAFWVSFESDPELTRTNANIYGRCLPCIQNLYVQLKDGKDRIQLGSAYNCWKITAIVAGIDECLALLEQFEKKHPHGHVYGKFGSGRPDSETRAVVFHADTPAERDRIQKALNSCLAGIGQDETAQISRACEVLFKDILGPWQDWRPITLIKHPRNVKSQLDKIKKILYQSSM